MASPFVPSHKRRFVANKVFTDRERPVTQFLRAFDPPPAADEHRVVAFNGVGGEGKTALAHHLRGLLAREYAGCAGWAAVNFEDAAMRRPAEALLSIRLQLRQTAGLAFPAFDTAFAHWFGKSWPGASVRERHPELFRQPSETAADALDLGLDVLGDMDNIIADALGEVPGLSLIWKYGNRFHARFQEWWARRGKEVLRGIEALQPDQLLDRLPAYLGADLADAIAAMPTGARRPLAIIGDTLEAFHRSEAQQGGGFAFRNDRWLRELVKETPGVLFVLLGRDRLRWAEAEPEWAQVLEQLRLGALSPEDAEAYLLLVPVSEPEVRARMVQGAQGLPFYLDLQVDLYEGLRNRGEMPEPARFGGSEPEILDRFLDHLGPAATRALTVLAHCRRFDEALWLRLGREFMGGLPPFAFGDLTHFSFVEGMDGGWLGLHALMREALTARTAEGEPVLHEQLHRSLFGWWDERCQPTDLRSVSSAHELALEEAALHRTAFEPESFGDWTHERGQAFCSAARYAVAEQLFKTALGVEEATLASIDPKLARTLNSLGNIHQDKGELDQALVQQERVLAIKERAYGPKDPELARTLNNLGTIYHDKSELNQAMALLERALEIFEHAYGPDHPDVARTLGNLGNVLQDEGKLDAALTRQERALAIEERAYGRGHVELARTLNNIGNTLRLKGELVPALARQERALAILEYTYGAKHPDVARTLKNLGIIHRLKGEPDAALVRQERALAIEVCAYGPDHPEVARTLGNLGNLLLDKGELDAATAHLERALAIFERTCGPEHPEVARTLGNLGNVLQLNGELAQALVRHQQALALKERAYGSDHPEVGITLFNLAEVERKLGSTVVARERMQRALGILTQRLGAGHSHTETVRQALEKLDASATGM